jgi:hypothetical protein
LHEICITLLPVLTSIIHFGHTRGPFLESLEVINIGYYGLDVSLLYFTVNDTGSLRGQSSLLDGPSTNFFGSSCVKGLEA